MPSLIKKLFRRKSSVKLEETSFLKPEKEKTKISKKDKKSLEREKSKSGGAFNESILSPKVANSNGSLKENILSPKNVNSNNSVSSLGHNDDFIRRKPSFKTASPDMKSPRVLAQRNENVNNRSASSPVIEFDTDAFNNFADFGDENRENQLQTAPVPLSFNHLQQFEMQQAQNPPERPLHAFEDPNKPQFTRQSDGQLTGVTKPGTTSPTASSDLGFSTDAEDVEYNRMRQKAQIDSLMDFDKHPKHKGSRPPFNPMVVHSYMDDDSSSEEEEKTNDNEYDRNRNKYYISDCEDDMNSPAVKKNNNFSFENFQVNSHLGKSKSNEFDEVLRNGIPAVITSPVISPKTATSNEMKGAPDQDPLVKDSHGMAGTGSRNALPDQQNNAQNKGPDPSSSRDLYPDSSDSEVDIGPSSKKEKSPKAEMKPPKSNTPIIENFADFHKPVETKHNKVKGSKSVTNPTSPISSILEKLNENRKSRKTKTSGSIKSAPHGDAAYLRQQHQLGKLREALDLDRKPSSRRNITSEQSDEKSELSTGDRSAVNSAKEKLRSRRKEKLENSKNATNNDKDSKRHSRRKHKSRSASNGMDDDSDGVEDNDWLFDEVTGALGPRGIAADLESLGGSSYRSGKSLADKSTRSHRSRKSHRSSRRHKSSNDSVDSRQSRTSHYSRKSTRSVLSHMSEQSRSVANDLLRLEMQLAMKGAQAVRDDSKNADGDGRSVGSSGVRSYSSRISRTSLGPRNTGGSKRTKVNITAPPGKLGIILANKSDSKGTVVSGVRTSSVLVGSVSPGDRIVEIDGEDVSKMTVSEITTIMARKSEFERVLTVLVAPQKRNAPKEEI